LELGELHLREIHQKVALEELSSLIPTKIGPITAALHYSPLDAVSPNSAFPKSPLEYVRSATTIIKTHQV
jgi:hypothetical protein